MATATTEMKEKPAASNGSETELKARIAELEKEVQYLMGEKQVLLNSINELAGDVQKGFRDAQRTVELIGARLRAVRESGEE